MQFPQEPNPGQLQPEGPGQGSDSMLGNAAQGALLVPDSSAQGAVLSLDKNLVEWCEILADGRVVQGHAEVVNQDMVTICGAALAAREDAGGVVTHCTIALGPSLAPLTRISLPPLKGKDLNLVLTRRAAQSLGGTAADPRFHAIPLGGDAAGEAKAKQQIWLMTAFDALPLDNLVRALSRVGLTCDSSSSRILAGFVHAKACLDKAREQPVLVELSDASENESQPQALEASHDHRDSQSQREGHLAQREGHLALLVEAHGASIGLQEGDSLLHVNRIHGDLCHDPGVGAAVIQDLRSLASFFRKESRGGQISAVVIVGLAPDPLALLSLSIKKALPGAEIVSSSKIEWLGEAAVPGLSHPKLSNRRSRLATTLSGAALAMALLGAGVTWRVRAEGLDHLSHANQDLQVIVSDNSRLEGSLGLAQEMGHRISMAEQQLERLASLSQRDMDLGAIVTEVAEVMDHRATVRGFSCRLGDNQVVTVEIDGVTNSPALESHALVESMQREMQAKPGVQGFALELPVSISAAQQSGVRAGGLEFQASYEFEQASEAGEQERRP